MQQHIRVAIVEDRSPVHSFLQIYHRISGPLAMRLAPFVMPVVSEEIPETFLVGFIQHP